MAYEHIKTEHAGAKNGGGAWMTRAEAKENARRRRRQVDKQLAGHARGPWTNPDPQAGDFDAELDAARPEQIQIHPGNADAQLRTLGSAVKPAGAND